MRWPVALAGGLLALAGTAPAPGWGASFDCAKARTTVEKTICGHPVLDAQDTELGRLYRTLRRRLAPHQAQALRDDQRQWLRLRGALCPASKAACLQVEYAERNADLTARLQDLEPRR
ncbi:MAG: lysozyme inhibitor LprI family protein [Candidatus Competibacterales bacterium]